MKIDTRKVALMIMLFAFGMSANASDLSVRKNYGDKLPIVLKGYMGEDIIIRGEEPIEIYQQTSMIVIQFNVSLGELNIYIENENGNVVYSSSTNTSSRLVNMIPIGNFPNGDYIIIIEGDNGSAEASFRIEQ
ncbi:MAG: DUF3244 domain-containing protein [Bacteroidales bacterium]|nr:DUF3244 domain-containing protein [Bacteroidales bacterium]